MGKIKSMGMGMGKITSMGLQRYRVQKLYNFSGGGQAQGLPPRMAHTAAAHRLLALQKHGAAQPLGRHPGQHLRMPVLGGLG